MATRNDRFHGFQDLIQNRVQDVLLVSSLYDYYILSQDGRLNEQFLAEFLELNLRHTPTITHVFSGQEALSLAHATARYNLIITSIEPGDMNVLQLVSELRRQGIETPVVLLAYDRRKLARFIENNDITPIERIFLWQGDVRILLAIVKYMEDKMNVDYDTGVIGVPAIVLVEDNIRYYSSFLPVIYSELVKHSQSLMPEGLNLSDKLMRIRARPKILLGDHYEQAWDYFERFSDNVLGIISDIQFPRNGERSADAGVQFAKAVRTVRPDVPIMLQSSREANAAEAHALGASFLLKGSPLLLNHVREFMVESLRIGDFVFRLPDGTEIGHASDLKTLEQMLEDVPAESVAYHGERNDFSTWLKARTEFGLAEKLRPRKVSDYATLEDLRNSVIESIAEYRAERNRGQVVDFDRNNFDASASFYRVGGGSLGGKARGIAFVNNLLNQYHINHEFPDVAVSVPTSIVIGTDVFDRFMEDNHLSDFAINCDDDDELQARFQAASFTRELTKDLKVFLDRARYPLAVRSSSLLEDSQHHPFAGVYETYMLANNHRRLGTRLDQLLAAVKRVYASTFSSRARIYLESTQHRLEEESMAVIIQRVVGAAHDERFYPDFAGAARSHNFYPTPPAKNDDGLAAVALGLGKTVEEGGSAVRFSPKFPRHVSIELPAILKTSQRDFYAIDLRETAHAALGSYPLEAAEADGTLAAVASTYSAENDALYDGVSRPGPRVVTLAPLLKHGVFPLADILDRLLTIGCEGTGAPIEIEFAATLAPGPDGRSEFGFLQLRPLVLSQELEEITIGDVDDANTICRSPSVLGNGLVTELADAIVVDYHRFERKDSRLTANTVSQMDSALRRAGTPYVLIGVGRWGSREPYLGIPVNWSQISGARVIVEAGFRDFPVTPSQGTHFFQNLISNNVGYFTVNPEEGEGYLDWDWLAEQAAITEDGPVRHLRFESPLTVKMDGRRNEGVILKPGV